MQQVHLAAWQTRIKYALAEGIPGTDAPSLTLLCSRLRGLTFDDHTRPLLESKAEEARHSYRRWLVAEGEGFTAILIGWPPGFMTPIHDHDGLWGIELVIRGRLHVDEFLLEDGTPNKRRALDLNLSEAAVFDRPDYAHACSNPSQDTPALSLHVYGGTLEHYATYSAHGSVTTPSKTRTTTEKL